MKTVRRVVAWAMLAAGATLDTLVWLHVIAKREPPLVTHLSTWALIYAGFIAVTEAEQ